MDEEEQKRQAASAAFAQAERQNRDSDGSIPRREARDIERAHREAENDRVSQADNERFEKRLNFSGDTPPPHLVDEAGRDAIGEISTPYEIPGVNLHDTTIRGMTPGEPTRYPFATQWDRDRAASVPPAAASAFSQLDAPAPGPLEYDPATAAGLPQETQDAFRRNWDENLAAARKAIEGNGPGKEERDALAIYTDQLVRMADDYQANRNRVDRAQAPADPYVAQRKMEARVASRLGNYDLFSDPNATRRLYTPQSSQANAYQLALDGGQENAKPFFDYF